MSRLRKLKIEAIKEANRMVLNEQEENEFCSKFSNSVYGEGESRDMSMSREKSLHNAKVNLSKKLNKSSVTTKIVEEKNIYERK